MRRARFGLPAADHKSRSRVWLARASQTLRQTARNLDAGQCRLANASLISASEQLGRALAHVDSAPGSAAWRAAWAARFTKLNTLRDRIGARCMFR